MDITEIHSINTEITCALKQEQIKKGNGDTVTADHPGIVCKPKARKQFTELSQTLDHEDHAEATREDRSDFFWGEHLCIGGHNAGQEMEIPAGPLKNPFLL